MSKTAGLLVFALGALSWAGQAAETNTTFPIDLPAALRLAGAQNVDVLLAAERVRLAEATHEEARLKFFPWIEPTVGYRRHEGNIQDVGGRILDVNKQSYSVGAALNARVEFGDAIYGSLATRQLVKAAEENREANRQDALLQAASGYLELARAEGAVGVARDSLRIAEDYAGQLDRAVSSGIAFKGDAQRAAARVAQARIVLRQAEERFELASARLVRTLRLEPGISLDPQGNDLAALGLVESRTPLSTLLAEALARRPELRQSQAEIQSARALAKGAKYGPLIPTLGAQANFYGLGGGQNQQWGSFDDGQDYFVGLSWKIGPGGLLDHSRVRAAESRERVRQLEMERVRDEITRQVVEARSRVLSLGDQVELAKESMAAAEETWRLSRERKQFGVGAVLETIQAEQDYTAARLEYLRALAEHNAAQFSLVTSIGQPLGQTSGLTPGASGSVDPPARAIAAGVSAGGR